jgi:membrane protease YdiL (CAAX protease family)
MTEPALFRRFVSPFVPLGAAFQLTIVWGLVFGFFFAGGIVGALGWWTLVVAVYLCVFQWKLLRQWLLVPWKEYGLGVLAGVLMAGLTYLLFPVGTAVIPGLEANVTTLYHKLFAGPGPRAMLPWMLLIMSMEELVFRGLWMEPLLPGHDVSREPRPLGALLREPQAWQRVGLSVALYTLVHVGAGSLLLCGLTVACGLVWSWMREWRGSLAMPLLCHIVWDLFVFIYFPLVSV